MSIDIGVTKDIITGEPEDGGWYGAFHDPQYALKVFQKLRRQQKYKGKPSLNVGLGDNTAWLDVPATVVEEAIRRSPSQCYRNCKVSTVWWFKLHGSFISAWPRMHRDDSLNIENNWGEEE